MKLFRLSLTASCIAILLSGCGDSSTTVASNGLDANAVSFTHIDAVDTNETAYGATVSILANNSPLRQVVTSPFMNVYGTAVPLEFRPIIMSGDQPVAGGASWGEPIKSDGTTFGSTNLAQATAGAYLNINSKRSSYSPDHSTLLQKDGKIFSISQFENYNGSMYITELIQSAKGILTAIATKPINLSGIFGGWDFCAGVPSPWGSHLGGEEYPADARIFETATTGTNTLNTPSSSFDLGWDEYFEYWGLDQAQTNSTTKANPTRAAAAAQTSIYRIGYPVEVKLTSSTIGTGNTAGNTSVSKHYSMGRLAWELPYVMPDKKTVYMGDDGSFRGMFRYVADTAENLSSGKLYAAKLTQTSADNGGTFTIAWKPLYTAGTAGAASVTDAEINTLIAGGINFSDMIDYVAPTANACPTGYTPYVSGTSVKECIKLKGASGTYTADQINKAASRLETLRYAVIMGATQEFEKYEGITFDPSRSKLYIAMSSIRRGMANNYTETLTGATNDINIAENLCGAIYQLDVNSSYETTSMKQLISGESKTYNNGKQCDIDKIAMPDNVVMGPTNDYILIGEDSDWVSSSTSAATGNKSHRNDVLWAYDLKNSKLTRIMSSPVGAEITSPWYYRNINGWDYITAVIQHPYGESDMDQTTNTNDKRAVFGVIGPIPTFTPR
ncbi:MAG: alkaline phosphatase PhoX [Betaproteobacteria bacterium]